MSKKLSQDIFKDRHEKWQWAAMDADNLIPTLFTNKPKKSAVYNFYINAVGEYQDLYEEKGYNTRNWEDSLIEREVVSKVIESELQKSIELLESGIGMNWSDMKKIETRLNRGMSGMQTKLNELNLQIECQQSQLHLAAKHIGLNKQAILRIENKDELKPQLKQLDQSVFEGEENEWLFAAVVEDGRCLYYSKKPVGVNINTGHFTLKGDYKISFAGDGYDTTNWQNSVIERELKLKTLDQSVFEGLDKKWQFAAVDKNGSASYYDGIPDIRFSQFIYWDVPNGAGQSHRLSGTYNAKKWEDSLIMREAEVELTGSELAKAMLDKGAICLMCKVSDISDKAAHAVDILTYMDADSFVGTKGSWSYAVPINNKGGALTAKEAGII